MVTLALIGLVESFWGCSALIVVWGLLFAATMPIRQTYLNGLIPSRQRATILSFDSLMGSTGGVWAQPRAGPGRRRVGLRAVVPGERGDLGAGAAVPRAVEAARRRGRHGRGRRRADRAAAGLRDGRAAAPRAPIKHPHGRAAASRRAPARRMLSWPEAKRLMTVPGVNLIAAASFLAAVGDIARFGSSSKPSGVWVTHQKMRQAEKQRAAQA